MPGYPPPTHHPLTTYSLSTHSHPSATHQYPPSTRTYPPATYHLPLCANLWWVEEVEDALAPSSHEAAAASADGKQLIFLVSYQQCFFLGLLIDLPGFKFQVSEGSGFWVQGTKLVGKQQAFFQGLLIDQLGCTGKIRSQN